MGIAPRFRVTANNEDITEALRERFVSLRLTDKAGLDSDELTITLADHDPQAPIALPPAGAELTVWLGYDDQADEMGVSLAITRAAVGGGALFPSLRQDYKDRGILCLQSYATADLGNIAYESPAMEGMIADEQVVVEIVTPGTGDPVAPGEVGEVVVTNLNPDYPLIRFATGDLSAVMEGNSPCGRTNMRIKGWMGRADQTTKIKGMFIRPEQVAALVAKHSEIVKARVIARRVGEMDTMTVQVEAPGGDGTAYARTVADVLKLKGAVEVVAPGSLPKDGLVIEDQRKYE